MNLHIKMLLNDFRKRAWKNIILFVFMCLSVTVAAAVVLMLTQLFTSLTSMYETAKPPHFLQMHMGQVNQADIDEFNRDFEGITHWQTTPMITVNGEQLVVEETGESYSLEDCRLDISLVKQNDGYDVLLDAQRKPLEMAQGEIGVPVIILDQYDIALGDTITLNVDGIQKQFAVAAYVYDGQMNSTICSSTRFLISDADFDDLLGTVGATEYLIEAWFTDSSLASDYQTAYEQSEKGLPKDGQAITYTLIFLLSALTDILTAMVFVLAGTMLIVVVVMCLRYVILAELEDDVTQIGTMKSIGIPEKGIEKLYLSKIQLLMVTASVAGFALALVLLPKFTGHVSRFFGEQPLQTLSLVLSLLAVAAIYGIIILFAKKILRQIKSKTVVDLMVLDQGFRKKVKVKSGLYKAKRLSTNALIGLQETRNGYGIIFVLMLIITFLVMVPIRTQQTLQAEDFVTYMGSPVCDLLVEVTQGDGLEDRNEILANLVNEEAQMGSIQNANALRRVRLQALGGEGKMVGIHVDTGVSAGTGIVYIRGEKPSGEDQIALSALLAEELGKDVGDTVQIMAGTQTYHMTVCGVYQDVTSGGKTAKTIFGFPGEPAEKFTYQLDLGEDVSAETFADSMKASLGYGYSIKSMDSFLDQTLGGVTSRFGQAVYWVVLIGIVITVFIVLLFMELRFARTMHALAEKLAIGIPVKAICAQELYPMLLLGGAGILSGVVLTETVGELVVSVLFSLLGLGISSISFTNISAGCILIPVGLLVILAVINVSVCLKVKKIDIAAYFNQ